MFSWFKNYLYLFLAQYRVFWNLKTKSDNFTFWTKKFFFKSRNSFNDKKETFDAYHTFTKWSIKNILFFIIITWILQVISPFAEVLLKALLHDYLIFDHMRSKLNNLTDSEYITFLSAIAAIGGVFIALYFSTLGGINATLYNTFSNNLRDLLYREKVGNAYIKFLSNTTFFAFTLIGFYLLGYEQIYIAIPIMLILIGITIFSYIRLGIYTSQLFNVDTLSASIFNNLYDYINSTIKRDAYSKDRSFQNHYFTLASKEIRLLKSLMDTSLNNYIVHNDSLQNISNSILKLLINYQNKKKLIPYKSLWYSQEQSYKDLYTMGNLSSLDISLKSATLPQADTTYNLFWIEDTLIPYIITILKNKILNGEIEDYKKIFELLIHYLYCLVNDGNIKYAIQTIKLIETEFNDSKILLTNKSYQLTHFLYSLPLYLILDFYNSIDKYSYTYVYSIVNSKTILNNHIQSEFHDNTIETIDWLQKRLSLELKAENKIISPKWYQVEILMLTISRNFIENLEAINALINSSLYTKLKDQDIQLYSVVLTQKWETINKYIFQFDKIENILQEYQKERTIHDLNWKKFSLNKLKKDITNLRKTCMQDIGKTLIKIAKETNENFPDIFGYFLQLTSENLLELAIEKNFKDIELIYPSFFISSFLKYEKLRPTFDPEIEELDLRKKDEFITAFHPLINLLEITGLIKILLEFYNEKPTWKKIKQNWLDLLNKKDNPITLELLSLSISMTEGRLGVAIGDNLRFEWKNKIYSFLETQVERDSFVRPGRGDFSFLHKEDIVKHNNPLIRVFMEDRRYLNDIDGIEIFIFTFVNKHYKFKEISFGQHREIQNLQEKIERNIEIYKEYKNARK